MKQPRHERAAVDTQPPCARDSEQPGRGKRMSGWSWALTAVGLTCFFLAGRKVWWAWYVGIAGQVLWLAYSLLTQQWGFLVGVALYTWVYVGNAVRWTREHRSEAHATE